MSIFDLHMHSHVSVDGEFTPKQLIEIAKEANITCAVLADHNSVEGVDAFMQCATENNILSFYGIECSTSYENAEVHVLGYNINHKNEYYQTLPNKLKELKWEAGRQIMHKFNERFGFDLSEDEVMGNTRKNDSDPFMEMTDIIFSNPKYYTHPDLKPYLPGGPRSEPVLANLYWDFCVKGCDCFVEVPYPPIKETIERIHKDGGIAILAHPWKTFYQKEDKLAEIISYGIDGIEAYSNYHEDFHNEYYDDFCKKHNLLMTCGSDFHGKTKPKIKMGQYGYKKDDEKEVLQTFINAIQKGR